MMECRVDHAWLHTIGDERTQRGFPGTTVQLHIVATLDAALLCIMGMDLQEILYVPCAIGGSARLRPDIVLTQDSSRREQEWKARARFFVGWDVFRQNKVSLAAHEGIHVHDRSFLRRQFVTGPLN